MPSDHSDTMQRAGLCSTTICENTRIPCNHLNDRNAAFTAALLERRVFRREAYWLLLDLHGSAATSSQASAVTGPNAAMRTKHQHRKRHGKTATRDLPPGRSAALLGCASRSHRRQLAQQVRSVVLNTQRKRAARRHSCSQLQPPKTLCTLVTRSNLAGDQAPTRSRRCAEHVQP